jgi:nucleolar protein 12
MEYGTVESVRLRSIAFAKASVPRKIAFKKAAFHPEREACNAYVVMASVDEAKAALVLNGSEFEGKTLRVDLAAQPDKAPDRSIFVGNLPFVVEEEALRAHFDDCGEIDNVRIVRDPHVNLGKGIAFVAFK